MSKMGADLADLKSKIKAQNKKGTAIEQEADKNTNLRLSAHFNALSGNHMQPHVHFCCLGLCLLTPPPGAAVWIIILDSLYAFAIATTRNTRTMHTHTNMQHAQQAAASCTNKAIL
jgi:hypothetical protein